MSVLRSELILLRLESIGRNAGFPDMIFRIKERRKLSVGILIFRRNQYAEKHAFIVFSAARISLFYIIPLIFHRSY